jgi:hypothetical protein
MSSRRTTPTARKAAAVLDSNEPEVDLLETQEPPAPVPTRGGRAGRNTRQQAQDEPDDVTPSPDTARLGRKNTPDDDEVPEPVVPTRSARDRQAAATQKNEPEDQEDEPDEPVPATTQRRNQTRAQARTVAAPQEDVQESDDLIRQSLRKAPRVSAAQKITVDTTSKTSRVRIGGVDNTATRVSEAKFESVFDKNDKSEAYWTECYKHKFDELRDEINAELEVITNTFKKQPKASTTTTTTTAPAEEVAPVAPVAPKGKRGTQA